MFLGLPGLVAAEPPRGTVVTTSLRSANLENTMGENATRSISVYLPPGYEGSDQRYPVIYFLHGFTGDDRMLKYISPILDQAIATHRTRPFIMVIPDEKTTYDGSFYSNSGVFGNWEDFTTYDLVAYVDRTYRTLARRESRGITGHSMGGYGALLLAMKHPDVFSTVYGLSPGCLAIVHEYGPNSDTYRGLVGITTMEDLGKTYFGKVVVAFGRSVVAQSRPAAVLLRPAVRLLHRQTGGERGRAAEVVCEHARLVVDRAPREPAATARDQVRLGPQLRGAIHDHVFDVQPAPGERRHHALRRRIHRHAHQRHLHT